MISIDETFPVDGDFMLFLLISGVGCWIWVFVEGTLFVHVNLFHLLFNAGLLLINQTPPAHLPAQLLEMHAPYFIFYNLIIH